MKYLFFICSGGVHQAEQRALLEIKKAKWFINNSRRISVENAEMIHQIFNVKNFKIK